MTIWKPEAPSSRRKSASDGVAANRGLRESVSNAGKILCKTRLCRISREELWSFRLGTILFPSGTLPSASNSLASCVDSVFASIPPHVMRKRSRDAPDDTSEGELYFRLVSRRPKTPALPFPSPILAYNVCSFDQLAATAPQVVIDFFLSNAIGSAVPDQPSLEALSLDHAFDVDTIGESDDSGCSENGADDVLWPLLPGQRALADLRSNKNA